MSNNNMSSNTTALYVSGIYTVLYSFGELEDCLLHQKHYMAIKNMMASINKMRVNSKSDRNDYEDYEPWLTAIKDFTSEWGAGNLPPDIKDAMAESLGVESIDFSDFIAGGVWDVDDVLRPIYEDASEALGQDFPYPEKSTPK